MDDLLKIKDKLEFRTKLSYGVGHILNDITASMWFSYMLLFFHKVAAFNNMNAGWLMFVGQTADGISTIFTCYESYRTVCLQYGRRKIWHLAGVTCVSVSFPFVFSLCIVDFSHASQLSLMIYYIPFIVLFQSGWASSQVTHLSLIPEMTTSLSLR